MGLGREAAGETRRTYDVAHNVANVERYGGGASCSSHCTLSRTGSAAEGVKRARLGKG